MGWGKRSGIRGGSRGSVERRRDGCGDKWQEGWKNAELDGRKESTLGQVESS